MTKIVIEPTRVSDMAMIPFMIAWAIDCSNIRSSDEKADTRDERHDGTLYTPI